MRAVDSSAWIEWLSSRGPLADEIGRCLPIPSEWVVPTIIIFELVKWSERERDENAVKSLVAFSQTCLIVPFDERIAVMAARLAREHRLATADAIIYATARMMDADLLTCDAHFDGLDGVIYLPKSA
jgi:predicted nucleic acid-binding protein